MSRTAPGHQRGWWDERQQQQLEQQHQEAQFLGLYMPLASNLADGSPSGIALGENAAADR